MKFEYEKPDLEELELVLEGSFLDDITETSSEVGGSIGSGPGGGDNGDTWD